MSEPAGIETATPPGIEPGLWQRAIATATELVPYFEADDDDVEAALRPAFEVLAGSKSPTVGAHPYVIVEAVPSDAVPDGTLVGLAHGGGMAPEAVPYVLQDALDQLRPEAAATRAEIAEQLGVVLTNETDSEGELYLAGTFEAQDLTEIVVRDVVEPLLAAHRRELDDERGSHAMTRDHFTHYSEEWVGEIAEQRREIARLTQLLDRAQLDRDQAQAAIAAAFAACDRLAVPMQVVGEALAGYWDAQKQIRAAMVRVAGGES